MYFTANDLLYTYLEFNSLTPNINDWTEKKLFDNKPRLIRLQQINALLSAFGITQEESENEIQSFRSGTFISKRPLLGYRNVIDTILHYGHTKVWFINNSVEMFDIERFFKHLLEYRILVHSILNQHSGVFTGSYLGFIASNNLTKPINNTIKKRIKNIDNILTQIIDPNGSTIHKQYLIDNFGFPTQNLDEIDFEYL